MTPKSGEQLAATSLILDTPGQREIEAEFGFKFRFSFQEGVWRPAGERTDPLYRSGEVSLAARAKRIFELFQMGTPHEDIKAPKYKGLPQWLAGEADPGEVEIGAPAVTMLNSILANHSTENAEFVVSQFQDRLTIQMRTLPGDQRRNSPSHSRWSFFSGEDVRWEIRADEFALAFPTLFFKVDFDKARKTESLVWLSKIELEKNIRLL